MSARPTVFLDRDGVINVNRPGYVKCWHEFEFLPRALPAISMLTEHGFPLVVVTNQAGVSKGLISLTELGLLHSRMCTAIRRHGGRVRAVLYCPHRPEENCPCRKPRPGLLRRAKNQLGVNLADAILVGDHLTDLEAAQGAGCRSVLVRSGRPISEPPHELPHGCIGVVPDLMAAAERIAAEFASGPAKGEHRLTAKTSGWAPAASRALQEVGI